MKKIVTVLVVLFFAVPSVSFAAGLTSQQANSLIAVVQSSPNTSASVFVPLITSFSNITVNQATSLIAVVQSAPSAPASAFVNLLISFTVDTPTTQSVVSAVPTVVYSNSCNGSQYPACMNGYQFVCPSNGAGYCISGTTATPQTTQSNQQTTQQAQQETANQAQIRYQTQYQIVQAKMQPLKDQFDRLQSAFSSLSCSSFQQGSAQVQCSLVANQSADVGEYENAILNDFLTPVTDLSITYENKLDNLSQQIFQVKMTYHQEVAAVTSTPSFLANQNARTQQLTSTANVQITALNQQKQSVLAEYQYKAASI